MRVNWAIQVGVDEPRQIQQIQHPGHWPCDREDRYQGQLALDLETGGLNGRFGLIRNSRYPQK